MGFPMTRTPDPQLLERVHTAARVVNVIVIAIPCLVLIGWISGIEILKRVVPGLIEMNPMSAVNFILLGTALVIARRMQTRHALRTVAFLASAFVCSFGLIMLCKYLTPWDAHIDRVLFTDSLGANRMAPNTALNFVLSGCALLLIDFHPARRRRPAEWLMLTVALISLLALVGYSYGVSKLYGVGAYVPMALHVAVNFMLLAFGVLCARPKCGVMARLLSGSAGGLMMRRMLFLMVAVPLFVGWLLLEGQRAGFYDAAFGFTVFVIVVIMFLSAMIWHNAVGLDLQEGERDEAENDLRRARDELDLRVTERTSALANVLAEIKNGIVILGSSAAEIAGSSAQLAANASTTTGAVSDTTTTVSEVRQNAQLASEKSQLVAESAQTSARISEAGREATKQAGEGMQRIRDQMGSIANSMMQLSEQTLTIGEIIASVEDIAEQSNLLALNAAIEAAKAGEHGRGFSVVAEAVRHLADESREATKKVRIILSDIKKATNAAVMCTEQGTKAVEAGTAQSAKAGESIVTLAERISEAADAVSQIAASAREQFIALEHIVGALHQVQTTATQNERGAKQLESAAQNLSQVGKQMNEMAERFKM